jgi:hypothetical protein
VLDLSGPKLRRAFEHLCEAAEDSGGIERYVGALALKSSLFADLLGKGRVGALSEVEFCDLCAFVTPARRRVGTWLARNGMAAMRERLEALLDGWSDIATAARGIRGELSLGSGASLGARSRRRGTAFHGSRTLSADDAMDVGFPRQYGRPARDLVRR